MKIAFLADHLVLGGLETHIISFTNELLERGHQILLYTASAVPEILSQVRDNDSTFHYISWTGDPVNDVKPFNPDIIHAHPFEAILKGQQVAEVLKKPFIVTIHGAYGHYLDRSPIGYKTSQYVQRIIAVDLRAATFLLNDTAHPEKISVIRNGINLNDFHPIPCDPEGRQRLALNPDWFTIAAISRLANGKEYAVLQLLRCAPALARHLGGLNLMVVGDGPSYPQVEKAGTSLLANSKNINIKIMGRQDNVQKFLAFSDVVLACGRAALEAMACQRPVFAMRNGFAGVVDQNNHHEILFNVRGFHTLTDEELICALAGLAEDKQYRDQLARDGYEIIRRYYDITENTTQLERIYEQYCR
ncbi:MAG: glycosyltransferase family 4 protein [Peptococcaceae bacterium]|nr:glycosyltransferase family 4 protein [Peptococcaceae bacterium]